MRSALCPVIANIAPQRRIDNDCRMATQCVLSGLQRKPLVGRIRRSSLPATYFPSPPDEVGLVV
ncbi:hypothetical protein AH448_00440 [Salmonella enterica subsp. diarizonae]|uniref:Uncharacterized protein n=4 Tax=Salmonella enterica TaxID=28901 RepID=A0A3R0B1A8_SALDZ|nr:hypothetical protein CHE29_01815 [Salmonella enterica]EAA0678502.1 hypothetical protein [Salmonella enterica subsp. diarizonae]EAS9236205.1 hypothetical protein [Salmonella enterica subsp. enterica]EBE3717907.1 hypothetical protein [Salmonella enterica subsp. diarizonae serovar 42:l,v:1,5,7]EBH8354145.1 hypothetical protein [Salmonella enterica subsp. diarizonae serovar 61:l,[v],[z13]:1,5,[7]]EBH9877978.1 hypothetical protein [Salmonella enterica subsp. enterica serovar 6,7:-1,5]EBW1591192